MSTKAGRPEGSIWEFISLSLSLSFFFLLSLEAERMGLSKLPLILTKMSAWTAWIACLTCTPGLPLPLPRKAPQPSASPRWPAWLNAFKCPGEWWAILWSPMAVVFLLILKSPALPQIMKSKKYSLEHSCSFFWCLPSISIAPAMGTSACEFRTGTWLTSSQLRGDWGSSI